MKAILTVIGKDRVGIIAGVSTELQGLNINILDVTQTIMQGNFIMIMMLDIEKCDKSFEDIKNALVTLGEKLRVEIKIQREEIFNSMHSL